MYTTPTSWIPYKPRAWRKGCGSKPSSRADMGKKNQRMKKKKRRIQPASDQTESLVSVPQEITTEVVALKAGDSKPEAQKLLHDQTESHVSAPQEITTEVVALKAGDSKPEAQKLLHDQTESHVSAPQEITTEVVALKAGDSKPEAQKLLPDQTESHVSAPQEITTEVVALKAGDSKPEAQKLLHDQTESHVSALQEITEHKNPHVYPLGDSDTVVTDIDSHADSEIDNIPKLKRTKSIIMDVIPDFTKALFDSSEDSASAIPGPSTSLSYRPRRKPYKHTRAIDLSSDESSGASDQEYIPNPREESTDSDASMESESKRKKEIRQTHSKRPFKKTQQKGRKRKCLKDQEIDPMEIQVPEDVNIPECTSTKEGSNHTNQARPFGKKERQTTVKRPWTTEECAAVEKHLKKYIVLNQVPGKLDCELCISAEPESLKNRDWKAVKYYVKNRITSVKRKCR
ncbi:uncharacterized protein LOC105357411 isoform X2 [Oryzias latipes]